MKEILLTRGYVAIVDDEDYEELSKHKWYAALRPGGPRAARTVRGEKRNVFMQRQILGALSGEQVDHRNHETLDNRRVNIRKCTVSQNHANRRKQPGTSSRFKGVHWRKGAGCWQAEIQYNGKKHHLGLHDDERAAARAYNAAAIEYFSEFALLNEV